MKFRIAVLCLSLLTFSFAGFAQRADVRLSLDEAFFDAALDSVFANFDPPSFPIKAEPTSGCDESVKVVREMNGVRTSVRFRNGVVNVPLAFNGHYSAPFLGCMEFAGWADSNIDLEFDRESRRLVGRVHVQTVNLNGTGGIGGSTIAKALQSSIDKRMPIEIAKLDALSFAFPIRNNGNLRMKVVGLRPEITNGRLELVITFEFQKA